MNKVLLIGVSVLGLFLSSEAYCAYCSTCCAGDETVFCPNSTSDEVCTAACGCCNDTTHEVVESSKKGYWNCCNKTTEEIYWNGSAALCCNTQTHRVAKVQGSPEVLDKCCDIKTYGEEPTAYWNGSSAQCCKGKPYKDGDTWNCCDEGQTLYTGNYFDFQALKVSSDGTKNDEKNPVSLTGTACCSNNPAADGQYNICCKKGTLTLVMKQEEQNSNYTNLFYSCETRKCPENEVWKLFEYTSLDDYNQSSYGCTPADYKKYSTLGYEDCTYWWYESDESAEMFGDVLCQDQE